MWRAVTESLAGNGIVSNGDLKVTSTANALEISVSAGTYYYVATEHTVSAAETHTLSGGDANYDRWDTVYLDTATGATGVREGTPGASPEPPDVQGDEAPLAFVYVEQNATDIGDSGILNWRARFSNEAEETHYDDTTGTYSVSDVAAALDELQEAAQIGNYPLQSADLETDSVGTAEVATGAITADEIATDAVAADEIRAGAVGTDEVSDGSLVDGDISGSTTIERGKLDDQRASTTVTSAAKTTADEEQVFVDTVSIAAASTITLASADATAGNTIAVLDLTGDAATYPITIDTEGTETIDGASSVTIDAEYSGILLTSDGGNWTTVSNAFAGVGVEDDGSATVTAAQTLDFGAALDATDNGDGSATIDANVAGKTNLATGTFTHTGGTATTYTVQSVTADQTANLHVELGVDSDPSFAADYAFSYTWTTYWDDANQELDVIIDATWDTDPGSGNDVVLDFEVYEIDDQATQGVGVEDNGATFVAPARSLDFGPNFTLTDNGDETVTVEAPPETTTPVAKLTTSDESTNINQGVLFPWTAAPMQDYPFSYDGTNAPTRLTVEEGGTYEVHVTVGMSLNGTNRDNPNIFLFKNRSSSGSGGTQLKAAGKTGYTRETDGHDQSSLHISWVGDLTAGEYLVLQCRRDASSGTRTPLSAETNLFAKKLNRP